MKDLTPEERALLGIADDDVVRPLEPYEPAPSEMALASAAEALPFEDVPSAIESHPDFDPVVSSRPGLRKLRSWTVENGIYRLPFGAEVVAGTSARMDDVELVDARKRPALVLVRDDDDEIAVRLEAAGAQPYQVERSLRRPLPEIEEPPSIEVPAPDIDALLAGEGAEAWLLEAAETLAASDEALSHLAAAGLLVRAWRPVDAAARQREIERFIEGQPGLVDRARRWVQSLEEATIEAVVASAVDRATVLPEQAETLRSAFGRSEEMAAAIAIGLVLARDDLAPVAAVLDLIERGASLGDALRGADRAIAIHATPLTACGSAVERRLGARLDGVAAADPDAWWAQLFVS